MTQEERLQALKDIRRTFRTIEEMINLKQTGAIFETIRSVESQIAALVEDAGEVTKPKMTTRIVNIASNSVKWKTAYEDVETLVNIWLDEHPGAEVIHPPTTNMVADREWTEFAFTMVVRVPETEVE